MSQEARLQIPVAPPLSAEAITNLTTEQLRNREILDPNYAGFDSGFNWRSVVKLETDNPKIAEALDKISSTPLGQHVLRQAYAIHQSLLRQANDNPDIRRQLGDIGSQLVLSEGPSTRSNGIGIVTINTSELAARPYFDKNGVRQPMTLEHVLFHEFTHLADAFGIDPAYDGKRTQIRSENMAMRAAILSHAGLDPNQPYRLDQVSEAQRASLTHLALERETLAEQATLRLTNSYLASVGQPERSLTPQFLIEQQEASSPQAPRPYPRVGTPSNQR